MAINPNLLNQLAQQPLPGERFKTGLLNQDARFEQERQVQVAEEQAQQKQQLAQQKQHGEEVDRLTNLYQALVKGGQTKQAGLLWTQPGGINEMMGTNINPENREKDVAGWLSTIDRYQQQFPKDTKGQMMIYREMTRDLSGDPEFEGVKDIVKEQIAPEGAGRTPKNAVQFQLPGGGFVLSLDGGRTYSDPITGVSTPLPSNAIKVPGASTLSEIKNEKTRQQAQKDLEGRGVSPGRSINPEAAALGGTGVWATAKAAIDNVLGGLGVDAIFSQKGIFPDTQKNRQVLRQIKQIGKPALMNSSRGAIWEQQNIDRLFPDPDKLFRNPRTQVNKYPLLREEMLIAKDSNNRSLANATSQKQIDALVANNAEIDAFLELIKETPQTGGTSQEDQDLIDFYLTGEGSK